MKSSLVATAILTPLFALLIGCGSERAAFAPGCEGDDCHGGPNGAVVVGGGNTGGGGGNGGAAGTGVGTGTGGGTSTAAGDTGTLGTTPITPGGGSSDAGTTPVSPGSTGGSDAGGRGARGPDESVPLPF